MGLDVEKNVNMVQSQHDGPFKPIEQLPWSDNVKVTLYQQMSY